MVLSGAECVPIVDPFSEAVFAGEPEIEYTEHAYRLIPGLLAELGVFDNPQARGRPRRIRSVSGL